MDYTYLKLIHLFSVMMFLGNTIIRLDRYFTIPGVILITTFGILAAVYGQLPLLRTGWILWSIILFTISGFAFVFKVAPLQKKIYRLTLDKDFDETKFSKVYVAWDRWALIATLTPLAAFVMMTLKIPQ